MKPANTEQTDSRDSNLLSIMPFSKHQYRAGVGTGYFRAGKAPSTLSTPMNKVDPESMSS